MIGSVRLPPSSGPVEGSALFGRGKTLRLSDPTSGKFLPDLLRRTTCRAVVDTFYSVPRPKRDDHEVSRSHHAH